MNTIRFGAIYVVQDGYGQHQINNKTVYQITIEGTGDYSEEKGNWLS
jgi:hypothetical protein